LLLGDNPCQHPSILFWSVRVSPPGFGGPRGFSEKQASGSQKLLLLYLDSLSVSGCRDYYFIISRLEPLVKERMGGQARIEATYLPPMAFRNRAHLVRRI
jgi:hypothetical protein